MTLSRLASLGIVLFSPVLAFGVATGMTTTTCILLTGLIVTIYTSIGGLKAVIWTDVVQFSLMLAGLIAILVKGTNDIGGVGEVLERNSRGGRIELFNFDFNPYLSNNIWTVVLGTSFVYTACYSIDQLAVQRSISLPSIRKAKRALYWVLFGMVLIHFLVIYFGMLIYANFYKCDPTKTKQISRIDEIVTLYVSEIFKSSQPGMLGLFVTCIFSASLSTLSSGLNAIAALIWEDWLKSLLPNIRTKWARFITKFISALTGLIVIGAAFLAMNIGTIFEASFILVGAPIGPLFGLFVLGVFFPFVDASGALFGLIFGQGVQLILPASTDDCDKLGFPNITEGTSFEQLKYSRIPNYSPNKLNALYHLSPLFVPVITFSATVLTGVLIGAIFERRAKSKIRPELHCKLVNIIYGVSGVKEKLLSNNEICRQDKNAKLSIELEFL
ncbi:hypothetical protein B4U79_11790 [Dinothrombium tinctorium]|uniref:Sodium-coupled monocarboxylate transporter 1-like protein n=1 Tax=Dinothrombium tinctorium TaxID=1965070 RepID=A0A3S3S621_9ACAR|nr:hypothetical protein B4U79_11790 [Dinothrombium tinctorium]